MNIGIFFSETNESVGGGFQYEVSIANFLIQNLKKEYSFKFYCTNFETKQILKKYNIEATNIGRNIFFNFLFKINLFYNFKHLQKTILSISPYKKFITQDNIDLVYFTAPNHHAMYIEKCNFITTCWDICHRDNVEFPEVRTNYSFELREILFHATYPKSQTIICESKLTKKNLIKWYGIDSKRIKIIPLFLSINQKKIKIKNIKYEINKKNYLFYPGQLWSHKNHIYVLDSLKILKIKYKIKINFYFCGSDKGNLKNINNYSQKLGISDQIKYLGFLNNDQIQYYYRNAFALVMPTYFGPSNYPPLEALSHACPVIYNLFGSEDNKFKSAVWNIDIKIKSSLAKTIFYMKKNPNKVKNKIKKGLEYFSNINEKLVLNIYRKIFDSNKELKKRWNV
jgi:glycosyltransferase involved in cell wall biosynthesis